MLDIHIPESFAYALFYSSTIFLAVVSVLGLIESIRALKQANRDVRVANRYFEGDVVEVVKARRDVVVWFSVGFSLAVVGSIVAISAMLYLPPPSPDRSLSTAIVRIMTVLAFLGFWKGKISSRKIRNLIERKNKR